MGNLRSRPSNSEPKRVLVSIRLDNSFLTKDHSHSSALCEILNLQTFTLSEGPKLKELLTSLEGLQKFGNIQNKLHCLLGNGRNEVLLIPDIVDELLLRNYPEILEYNGASKLVIFVPEWYLTKAVNYIEPSRGAELQEFAKEAANACPEREKYFEDMKKFYMGGQRMVRGELPERTLYEALQARFIQGDYYILDPLIVVR